MPYTLDKLREVRKSLDDGDVLGACKPLNELIDRYERLWREYAKIRDKHNRQHCKEADYANHARTEISTEETPW